MAISYDLGMGTDGVAGKPQQQPGETRASYEQRLLEWKLKLMGGGSLDAGKPGLPPPSQMYGPTPTGERLGDFELPPTIGLPPPDMHMGEVPPPPARPEVVPPPPPTQRFRGPAGRVASGLRAPWGASGPDRQVPFGLEITGFDPAWGTPPFRQGLRWSEVRFIYEPDSDDPRNPYRPFAEEGLFVQAYQEDGAPGDWRLRWVSVPTPLPELGRPYQVQGPAEDLYEKERVDYEARAQADLELRRALEKESWGARFKRGEIPAESASRAPMAPIATAPARTWNVADYAWIPQAMLPPGCPYAPFPYLPVPLDDYTSGRWLAPDYTPSIPVPPPYDQYPWRCGDSGWQNNYAPTSSSFVSVTTDAPPLGSMIEATGLPAPVGTAAPATPGNEPAPPATQDPIPRQPPSLSAVTPAPLPPGRSLAGPPDAAILHTAPVGRTTGSLVSAQATPLGASGGRTLSTAVALAARPLHAQYLSPDSPGDPDEKRRQRRCGLSVPWFHDRLSLMIDMPLGRRFSLLRCDPIPFRAEAADVHVVRLRCSCGSTASREQSLRADVDYQWELVGSGGLVRHAGGPALDAAALRTASVLYQPPADLTRPLTVHLRVTASHSSRETQKLPFQHPAAMADVELTLTPRRWEENLGAFGGATWIQAHDEYECVIRTTIHEVRSRVPTDSQGPGCPPALKIALPEQRAADARSLGQSRTFTDLRALDAGDVVRLDVPVDVLREVQAADVSYSCKPRGACTLGVAGHTKLPDFAVYRWEVEPLGGAVDGAIGEWPVGHFGASVVWKSPIDGRGVVRLRLYGRGGGILGMDPSSAGNWQPIGFQELSLQNQRLNHEALWLATIDAEDPNTRRLPEPQLHEPPGGARFTSDALATLSGVVYYQWDSGSAKWEGVGSYVGPGTGVSVEVIRPRHPWRDFIRAFLDTANPSPSGAFLSWENVLRDLERGKEYRAALGMSVTGIVRRGCFVEHRVGPDRLFVSAGYTPVRGGLVDVIKMNAAALLRAGRLLRPYEEGQLRGQVVRISPLGTGELVIRVECSFRIGDLMNRLWVMATGVEVPWQDVVVELRLVAGDTATVQTQFVQSEYPSWFYYSSDPQQLHERGDVSRPEVKPLWRRGPSYGAKQWFVTWLSRGGAPVGSPGWVITERGGER